MRKLIIIVLIFIQYGFELNAQVNDSSIQYKSYENEFNSSSPKNDFGAYYESIKKELKRGDKLFISYSSTDLRTSVYIKSPSGKTTSISSYSDSVSTKKSHCEFQYEAKENGVFDFIFTTIDPVKTGKWRIITGSTNIHLMVINPEWNCGRKLNFLLNQSHTNFEFISTHIYPANYNIGYVNKCNLFNEAPSVIIGMESSEKQKIYQTTFINNVSLPVAENMIKGVDEQIRQSLSRDWTIDTVENSKIIKQITYTQKGNYEYECNDFHKQNNIKNKITLSIERSGDTYKIVVEIY